MAWVFCTCKCWRALISRYTSRCRTSKNACLVVSSRPHARTCLTPQLVECQLVYYSIYLLFIVLLRELFLYKTFFQIVFLSFLITLNLISKYYCFKALSCVLILASLWATPSLGWTNFPVPLFARPGEIMRGLNKSLLYTTQHL